MPRNVPFTIEFARDELEKRGHELLSETVDDFYSKLKYRCGDCKAIHEHPINTIRTRKRCRNAHYANRHLSDDEIISRFADKGFEYIEELPQKKGKERRFKYRCACGSISETYISNLDKIKGCIECAKQNSRVDFEIIRQAFADKQLTLLSDESDYVDNTSKLEFHCNKCDCDGSMAYVSIYSGYDCYNCAQIKKSKRIKEQNPQWNPIKTDEERHHKRFSYEYRDWQRRVWKRDDFTCQVCMVRGRRLNAHHLLSYAKFKELRFDVDNGVTICHECHSTSSHVGFHRLYGTHNTTPEQFYEFKYNRQVELGIIGITKVVG